MRRWIPIALLCLSACTPTIGDRCVTSLNCSINGDRFCDTSVKYGVCTVFGCESGTCPDNAVCVRWRSQPGRLSFTACMRTCEAGMDGQCRYDDGFRCCSADDLATGMCSDAVMPMTEEPVTVEVVDTMRSPNAGFCVATSPPPP
jgi:hypothetical protein